MGRPAHDLIELTVQGAALVAEDTGPGTVSGARSSCHLPGGP